MEQVLQEIQVVKNTYKEKLYCEISAPGEQSTAKIQDQQEQPQQPLQVS